MVPPIHKMLVPSISDSGVVTDTLTVLTHPAALMALMAATPVLMPVVMADEAVTELTVATEGLDEAQLSGATPELSKLVLPAQREVVPAMALGNAATVTAVVALHPRAVV
jgi:hypothetical protein